MRVYNAKVFRGKTGFQPGGFTVSDGRIREVFTKSFQNRIIGKKEQPEEELDMQGMYVIPGLVDLHTHGNSGHDFSDGSPEGLQIMGQYLAAHGITAFAPASMTLPIDELALAFGTAERYCQERPSNAARLVGIHMEGPFLSEKKKGAQNSAFLRLPDVEAFRTLQKFCGDQIRIVDVAPELQGAEEFVCSVSPECCVSVSHTNASYEEAERIFAAGASHVTHLFNGMPQLHHRQSGVIGAAFDAENVTVELICDGIHVDPSVVRIAFRLFEGRICLISDSLRCCGCPDGEYELGGQTIILKDRQARLSDGNLAGAVTNLYEDMVHAIRIGISETEAVMAATLTPAMVLGLEHEIGCLETGCRADFLVCDADWNLEHVFMDGQKIW